MTTPTQAQEAIARGVAQYLMICARNTSSFGAEIPAASEGVGLHAVANLSASPNVAEVAYEIADEITQAAQAMLARELTTDERDDCLAAAFKIAPTVVELSRVIIEEASTRQGPEAAGGES